MSITALLRIASDAIAAPGGLRELDPQLVQLLNEKNGFVVFESALHVLPARSTCRIDLVEWNSPFGWRSQYAQSLPPGAIAFAQDALGYQFVLTEGGAVAQFNPETAELVEIATSIEGWAERILHDFESLTAWRLAHEWQMANGSLPADYRLMPVKPFILGGAFDCSNLVAAHSTQVLAKYAWIYNWLKDMPDGATVTWPPAGAPLWN